MIWHLNELELLVACSRCRNCGWASGQCHERKIAEILHSDTVAILLGFAQHQFWTILSNSFNPIKWTL